MFTNKDDLIDGLRRLDKALAPHQQAEVIVRHSDAFDWRSLDSCSRCGLPGHAHGQQRDIRFATNGTGGLHARVFSDHLAFHLDLADACRDVVSHVANDTNLIPFSLVGALLGYAAGGGRGALAGVVAGAAIGGSIPSRSMRRFTLNEALRQFRRAA